METTSSAKSARRTINSVVSTARIYYNGHGVKCPNIIMQHSTNLRFTREHSMIFKKLFASTMDNKDSIILGERIVCKAAPMIDQSEK